MKKIFSFIVFIIVSILTLCSCSKNKDVENAESDPFGANLNWIEAGESQTNAETENQQEDEEFVVHYKDVNDYQYPTCEEIQTKYPDKTVLIWVIETSMYDYEAPVRVNEINEYLDEQGYDYAVCFYPIKFSMDNEYYYTDRVIEMVENGEQADIIYTSFTNVGEAGNNAYHKDIYNGLFEPLDEYFKTEIGEKLYNIMPEKHWEGLRVNGQIYGVDGSMHNLSDDYGYYINAELADKYGYDISKSIDEQLDILQEVKENETCDVFAMYDNLNIQAFYSDARDITFAVFWDENEKYAKSVLENKVYLDRINYFRAMKSKGLLVDSGKAHTYNFFILQDNFPGGKFAYKDGETVNVDYLDNIIEAYPVFNENTKVRPSYMATGICSSSQYKDKAFELLALTQTDPYLNNLISFGIEGTDYNLVDGRVDKVGNRISLDRFINKMICYSFDEEPLDMAAAYTNVFKNANVPTDIDFAFDGRGVEKETADTHMALAENTFLYSTNFDESLSELENELEKCGIQVIIDECNKQYEEYKKQ